MPASKVIKELIGRFDRNLDAYRSGHYKETPLRRDFIDPFFKALGWDIDNEQGFAEAYREVVHEDTIRVGGAHKAPDYSFRIGGTRKFFLEAKKPSVDIKDEPSAAFQLRRYAWSAKLPLSILTDFEEFAVYDCRIRPLQTDKSSTARVMYLTFNEYADRWDELCGLFSKNAVLKGDFDRYVASTTRKRGTAEVDNAFLSEIETWRDELARNIALRNTGLSQREVNFAVGRTIDRIIFLRICEDRGIEEPNRLMALQNGTNIYRRLIDLYHRADEKYNSGLFHFRKERDRPLPPDELTLKLTIDDKVLKDIFKGLYYPDSPYEFSVLPADILGQVYEQFLGKVIRLTPAHHAKVEDKPEVKKAGGVYYTPTYIVDYIVQHTVGKLLEGKTPRQAAKLRLLDPACGSGSFLLGAYQLLLDWHRDWYVDQLNRTGTARRAPTKKHPIYQAGENEYRLTTAERKRILLNNIYGVDIDPQAVEVTKLSLLLKVLEEESAETINRQLKLLHERALPDLGSNIKCGNSLIGPDFYEGRQISLLGEEERLRINVFDWQAEFPEIFNRQANQEELNRQDAKGKINRQDAKEEKNQGGFDAVIGNPPYGAGFPSLTRDYLKKKYKTFVLRGESYLIFIERAINSLKVGGQFGYIIPDTYLNLGFTQAIRTFLLQNTKLCEIVLLPSNVFPETTVDTTLLFTEKAPKVTEVHEVDVSVKVFNKKSTNRDIEQSDRAFSVSTTHWFTQQAFNVRSDTEEIRIIEIIEKQNNSLLTFAEMFSGIKAYEVSKGIPPQTKQIRDEKPYTSHVRKDESWSPLYDGKHVGRYELLWKNNNWIRYGRWLAAPREPENFKGEKILIRKIIGNTLIATHIAETSYCNTLLFVLKLKPGTSFDYKYFLGVLNSNSIGWYFRKKFQISEDDTFPQIMIRDILQFPIPTPDKARHDKMVQLVERILALHKDLQQARTEHEQTALQRQINATDRQIDGLVYELYGLREEEVELIVSDKRN